MALEVLVKVNVCILDIYDIRYRNDHLVGISIVYLAIKPEMVNRCEAVT